MIDTATFQRRVLDYISQSVKFQGAIMSTIADLKTAVDALNTEDADIKAAVAIRHPEGGRNSPPT